MTSATPLKGLTSTSRTDIESEANQGTSSPEPTRHSVSEGERLTRIAQVAYLLA